MAFAQLTYRESLRDIENMPVGSAREALSYGFSRAGAAVDTCGTPTRPATGAFMPSSLNG